MKSMNTIACGGLIAAALALGGCGTPGRAASDDGAPPALLSVQDARRVAIFNELGEPVTWQALVNASAAAEAVILSEQHGHELGLSAAAALWRDLIARGAGGNGAGGSSSAFRGALALEFIERDDQSRLDDFLAGLSDEATFIRRAGRSSDGPTGGNWSAGHRDMVLAAKDAGRPVIAANSPRSYVRLARTKGFEALRELTDEQRRLFVEPRELPTGRYREEFEKLMGAGSDAVSEEKRSNIDGLFRAQSVWDWTMASSVNDAINQGHRPTVLVVGQFHSDFRGGLVQALDVIRPGRRVVTVSFQREVARSATSLPSDHKGRASFVVGTGE
ncbi:MAG: ChaN family lipoprotein [Phycisphaerales bacterium]|nr:ChaN family lipoprotein [Phycisphaerales bacterium]